MATAPKENPVLQAALAYADKGWPVFPCRADNKRPHTEHGFHDASTDSSTIRRWWMRWPDAMVACPTGSAVGAWVLDIDEPASFAAAADAAGLCLPATQKASTGKGEHIWFAWDKERPVGNAQKTAKGWPFPDLPGAETRGEGGYVILPPSRHPSGKHYAWQREEEPSDAPTDLLAIVTRPHRGEREAAATTVAQPLVSRDTPYGLKALEGECQAIRQAPIGAQEGTLNSAALKIGGLVAGGELMAETARSRLIGVGLGIVSHDEAQPWTAQQIVAKIERGLLDGAATPRQAERVGNERPAGSRPALSSGAPKADDQRPEISVRAGELHLMATEAETALLAADAPIYVRGGLMRPVTDEVPAAHGKRTRVARLCPVEGDALVDHLSRAAIWLKFNVRKNDMVVTDPPRPVAATILARDGEWRFRKLVGVITTPTMRPDGTILSAPGYDAETQLLLLDPPSLPRVADAPSREDAIAALATLDALLDEFPFVDDASRSVALSGLITPVVRGAMAVAPLHATSAPVAGSGKSYIIDLASAISTGERAPVIAAGRTEEETEKRLGAALLAGQPIVSIDNVNGELGGDMLCQMIERPIVAVRPLGLSKLVKIESRATVFATGNNIQLVGDMTRRVVVCALDPNVERPELRTFAANPFLRVVQDRGRYIAAALTVCRAYAVAGYPEPLPPLASFEEWSLAVRSALVWLGRADPCQTMDKARAEDPVIAQLSGVISAWYDAVNTASRTTGEMRALCELRNDFGAPVHSHLREALADVADDRHGGIDAKRLAKFLSRHNGRIVDGFKITAGNGAHAKQRLWKVARA